jgi:hypothetical protein
MWLAPVPSGLVTVSTQVWPAVGTRLRGTLTSIWEELASFAGAIRGQFTGSLVDQTGAKFAGIVVGKPNCPAGNAAISPVCPGRIPAPGLGLGWSAFTAAVRLSTACSSFWRPGGVCGGACCATHVTVSSRHVAITVIRIRSP